MRFRGLACIAACASILALALACAVAAAPPPSNYHLLKTIPLAAAPGGGEYFDYIFFDDAARRLYVSHGTEVVVIDADSLAVIGTVSGLTRCHGVAVVSDLGKGFITDGGAQQVVVFDTKTLKTLGTIKTFPDTDSILYDPASELVFSFNGDSKNASVIDPATDTVIKTIDLGGGPEFPVADGRGVIYDNNEETGEVVAIDTHTLTIKSRWPVAPAGGPTALAMDREHHRLFSSGRRPAMLVMMNSDTGAVMQSLPISSGVDANVFEPETGLLFVSTRAGTLHIFHEDSPDKLSEVQTVTTEFGAKTMALDPKTHRVYLSTADFDPPAAPTDAQPRPNPKVHPGTFHLLVYGQ
jgi:YVTN family beta-propeller protein